jgi:hypothetical protein
LYKHYLETTDRISNKDHKESVINHKNEKYHNENLASPIEENFDFSIDNKHENLLEKRREERKIKMESIKSKFQVEVDKTKDDNLKFSPPIKSEKLETNHFHMTAEQTTKLLRILEEEREINLKEGKIT